MIQGEDSGDAGNGFSVQEQVPPQRVVEPGRAQATRSPSRTRAQHPSVVLGPATGTVPGRRSQRRKEHRKGLAERQQEATKAEEGNCHSGCLR